MKEIRGKLRHTKKIKGNQRKVKGNKRKHKVNKRKFESIFWKVVFSTKLPSHEASFP